MKTLEEFRERPTNPKKTLGHQLTFGDLDVSLADHLKNNPRYSGANEEVILEAFDSWGALLEEINNHIRRYGDSDVGLNWDSLDYHISEVLDSVIKKATSKKLNDG